MDQATSKNFNFEKYKESMVSKWGGYVSSADKTNVANNIVVRGSQNMYKKLNGNWSVRPGLLRLGDANTTNSPISSEFVWYTSLGTTRTMVVSDNTLYAVIDNVWYPIQTGLTSTRYVFSPWYDSTLGKDKLLFVNGNNYIQEWEGGFGFVASTSNTGISLRGELSLTNFSISTNDSNITPTWNNLTGINGNGSIVFLGQPTAGNTLTLTFNAVTSGNLFSGFPFVITFVNSIGTNPGNVLRGVSASATLANLLGLLQNPFTTNTTQVGFTQIMGNGNASYTSLVGTGTTAPITISTNSQTAYEAVATLLFTGNPTDGETLVLTFNGSTPITLTFKTSITSNNHFIGPDNILLGGTPEETADHLMDYFTNPQWNETTHTQAYNGEIPSLALLNYSLSETILGEISYGSGNTITIQGNDTWVELGFSEGQQVVINGNYYTITGGSGTRVVTTSNDPTGEAVGSSIVSAIVTNSDIPLGASPPDTGGFTNDIIKVFLLKKN